MLRPTSRSMSAGWSSSGRVEAAEAEADTLAAAWEVVTRRPPPGRWERARHHLERGPPQHRDAPVLSPRARAAARRLRQGPSRGRRARALARPAGRRRGRRRAQPHQVVLVAETRMEGRPLAEVARPSAAPTTPCQGAPAGRGGSAHLRPRYGAEGPDGRATHGCARCRRGRGGGPPRPSSGAGPAVRSGADGPGAELPEHVVVGGAAQPGAGGVFGRREVAGLEEVGAEAHRAGDDGHGHGAR